MDMRSSSGRCSYPAPAQAPRRSGELLFGSKVPELDRFYSASFMPRPNANGTALVPVKERDSERRLLLKAALSLEPDKDPFWAIEPEIIALDRLARSGVKGVPEILAAGAFGDLPAFVMDRMPGRSVRSMALRRSLDLESAGFVLGKVCDILSEVHATGIVHRDLKTENLVFHPPDRSVALVDFGSSAVPGIPDIHLGGTVGTPGATSPELLLITDSTPVDLRSDIYSMGAMIYDLFTRKLPGHSVLYLEGGWHILENPAPMPLHEIGVPRAISDIARKAIEDDPDARFQSAAQMGEAIRRAFAPSRR